MADSATLELRLSRLPLFLLLLLLSFFFTVALDLSVLHNVIPPLDIAPDKKWIYYAFLFFMLGGGGIGAAQMLWYLLLPPVIFRADENGISFGTGFRYRPYCIPWKYVQSIGSGADAVATGFNRKMAAGLQVAFEQSSEIPAGKATSMGIFYQAWTLTLSFVYMNRKNLGALTAELETLRKRYQR